MRESTSRRAFLQKSLLASGMVAVWPLASCGNTTTASHNPWMFLAVGSDNDLSFYLPRIEMGQEVETSLAMIVANGLKLDHRLLSVKMLDTNSEAVPAQTVGSSSVRIMYTQLMEAGQAINYQFRNAAANRLKCSPDQCSLAAGGVISSAAKGKLTFSDLAEDAQLIEPMVQTERVYDRSQKGQTDTAVPENKNLQSMVTGTTTYSYDLTEYDYVVMVLAVEKSKVSDDILTKVSKSCNLEKIITLEISNHSFIGLVGTSAWQLFRARKSIFGLDASLKQAVPKKVSHQEFNSSGPEPGKEGQIEFTTDFVSHAPLECFSCVASFNHETQKIHVEGPTQAPGRAQVEVASALNVPKQNVTIKPVRIGGGFGRRRYADGLVEAAMVAQKVPGRVKLLWTREDEFTRQHYRPATKQKLSGDSAIVINSIEAGSVGEAGGEYQAEFAPFLIGSGTVKVTSHPSPYKTGIFRAVDHGYRWFSLGCYLDSLAAKEGVDPIDFFESRLRSPGIKERAKSAMSGVPPVHERFKQVLAEIRSLSDWSNNPGNGMAKGFSAYNVFGSIIAVVCTVTQGSHYKSAVGSFNIPQIWAVVDCGFPVYLDGIKKQIEGGLVFGLSTCLYGKDITDRPEPNFNDNPILTMSNVPSIQVKVLENDQAPGGVGELAVPPIAPAVSNAVHKLFGDRLNSMPFVIKD
ncbi:MAG: molybdopterin-dependent oxidoreductase [Pseudomonadales bacterium]|nr:molybdopterin-dependent oxidoreductase [Pseudomonadales bacterium]